MQANSKLIHAQVAAKPSNRLTALTFSAIVILLFAPVLLQLVKVWSTSDDYSHGFFVIPISLWMLWRKREILLSLPIKPLWTGLPILIAGLIVYSVSFVAKFHTLTHLSMILVIFGLLLFLTGWQPTKELLFPLLFLLFMFPIPSAYYILITNPLKLMITKISTQIMYLLGIPVYRDGNLLFFANTHLEVAEACSGVRSLYSYVMVACLFALMSNKQVIKMILVLSAIPLAFMINIARVSSTGVLSNYFGPEVAQGFFHEFSGFILFVIGFLFLYLEYYVLASNVVTKEA